MNKNEMINYIKNYLNEVINDFETKLNILTIEVDEETALIDLYAYHITGNYNWTIEDVYEDIRERYELND